MLLVTQMKFKKLAIAAIGLVVLLAGVARAADWVVVGESNTGTRVYLDTQSVQRRGKTVRYWEQIVLPYPDSDGAISRKYLNSLDCSTGNLKTLRVVVYDRNTQIVGDGPLTGNTTFSTLPGTIQEVMFKRVCKKR